MDKATVLEEMQTERANLAAILALLNNEQMCDASLEGQRSIKDILAHTTAWEQLCTGWIQCALRSETPETLVVNATDEDVDRLNERTFLENQNRPLQEVLSDSRHSYQLLLERVQALSEEELNDPNRYPWTEGRSLVPFIAANSYDHYREHIEQIRAWLDKQP